MSVFPDACRPESRRAANILLAVCRSGPFNAFRAHPNKLRQDALSKRSAPHQAYVGRTNGQAPINLRAMKVSGGLHPCPRVRIAAISPAGRSAAPGAASLLSAGESTPPSTASGRRDLLPGAVFRTN